MSFTARHYNEVARIIRTEREGIQRRYKESNFVLPLAAATSVNNIASDLRRMFAADNPRFDATRFDMACEPKEPTK